MTALELCADWHRTHRQLQRLYSWPRKAFIIDQAALAHAIRENEYAARAAGMLLAGEFSAANQEKA